MQNVTRRLSSQVLADFEHLCDVSGFAHAFAVKFFIDL